jgi:hypothetical protein
MSSRRIELHVEELVLHGVNPSDGQAVGEAVRAELSRLLTEQGLPAALLADSGVEVLRTEFTSAPGARGATLGSGVARAVYRGLPR